MRLGARCHSRSLLADVHDRMPVILSPEHYDLWLDPGVKRSTALTEMLIPFDATLMRRYPVSTRVNFVKNDDPECAAAVTDRGTLPAHSRSGLKCTR